MNNVPLGKRLAFGRDLDWAVNVNGFFLGTDE